LHADVPATFDVLGLRLVLNEGAQRLVQQKADGLRRHQPSFQARVDLADASFPIIDRILKEEGVPLDFRYLALQESALLGDAESAHGAVGYWQLKRETATELGLVVNNVVDERKHLAASTRAAARYLSRSNATLGNWLNTLISYNTGLGGVKPYVLPIDVGASGMLITETSSPYVLMFLAHKVAFEPVCGLNPKPALRLQEFRAVAGQSLEAQAQTIYADPAALAVHNRWLLASTVPTDRSYTLIVPITDAAQAAGVLANQHLQSGPELLAPVATGKKQAEVRLNNLRAIIALPGETPADLARRGGKKLGEFLHHNEMTAFDGAIAGLPYFLESKRDAGAVEYHVLQPGESIFEVAQKYGMRRKALLNKNRLAPNDEVRPGRVLWLQHTRPREVAAEYRAVPAEAAPEHAVADARTTDPTATASRVSTPPAPTARANRDSEDGWGDALPASRPAPVHPTAAEVELVRLPPRSAAPAPAPLADEPAAPEPAPAAASRPVVEPKAAPAVKPAPAAPVATPVAAKPAAAPVISKPAAAPAKPWSAPSPVVAPAKPAAAPTETTHRVEPKETVYSISRLFNISPATLMALNNLTPPANLAVGQVLIVKEQQPQAAAPAPAPAAKAAPVAKAVPPTKPAQSPAAPGRPAKHHAPVLYVPKQGAAPATAAKPAAAAPASATPASAAPATGATQHTVAKGETLYSIARLYNVKVADLKAWNAKADDNAKVGEVLRVKAPAAK